MKKRIKIIWISSYLPRSCGIAYYSHSYISALKEYAKRIRKKISVKVISHTDATQAAYPIINQKDRKWHFKVLKVIEKEKPDVVHIQHEYGLYETFHDKNKRVIDLIKMTREKGIPVVMTYHSVYRKLSEDFSRFVSKTLKELDAGILHCDYQRKALKSNIGWTPKNVYILPHGSREGLKLNRDKIREGFGYDNELVVGSVGLASERKGHIDLVKQWPKVVKRFPQATLVLELKPHAAKETRIYINKVLKEIIKSPVNKRIEFSVKDYSAMEFYDRLISLDVLVLPYKSESQSGVLAHSFSVGVPSIVTDIEGLGSEIRKSNAGIPVKKRKDFYKAIIKMLSSKRLRNKFSRNALRYVKRVTSWNIIAKKTFRIYGKIMR